MCEALLEATARTARGVQHDRPRAQNHRSCRPVGQVLVQRGRHPWGEQGTRQLLQGPLYGQRVLRCSHRMAGLSAQDHHCQSRYVSTLCTKISIAMIVADVMCFLCFLVISLAMASTLLRHKRKLEYRSEVNLGGLWRTIGDQDVVIKKQPNYLLNVTAPSIIGGSS